MKTTRILSTAALLLVLAACSGSGQSAKPTTQATETPLTAPANPQTPQIAQVDSIDRTQEVFYRCGAKGNEKLSVMYGIKGGQVLAAQVKYKNELTPNLYRVLSHTESNVFTNQGVTWIAQPADAATLTKVDGNMLVLDKTETVNGEATPVSYIVTKYCKLDKAATAKAAK